MDIRDVKEEPRDLNRGFLEEIYSLQKGLIDKYIKIEGIPSYPVDVNTKQSQVLLKDFTGRVIEELAEGYESHLMVMDIMDSVGGNMDLLTEENYNQIIAHLQNLNEEQADAMHFMVELLIYANIYPEDINRWIDNKVEKEKIIIAFSDEQDILKKAMELGYKQNEGDYHKVSYCYLPVNVKKVEVLDYIPGGRFYNREEVFNNRGSLWDITYALNLSRNCLKNKPWKQSGVMTNEVLYQSKLVEGFIYMMGYYARLGITPKTLYYLYFKKNKINEFRINSKY